MRKLLLEIARQIVVAPTGKAIEPSASTASSRASHTDPLPLGFLASMGIAGAIVDVAVRGTPEGAPALG